MHVSFLAAVVHLLPVYSSSGEQEAVEGLSDLMAAALKVVSAPDAFLQKDQDHRSIALPCFSFNKRGALVKTMSRKRSLGSQQSSQGKCDAQTALDQQHMQRCVQQFSAKTMPLGAAQMHALPRKRGATAGGTERRMSA